MARPLAECTCKGCGKTFTVERKSLKCGRGQYCSRACKGLHVRRSAEDRFWDKIEKTESCWLWRGSCNNQGYGVLQKGGRNGGVLAAHRVAWEIHFGPIPEDLCICHTCDVRHCVNPTHLFLGTPLDNTLDMVHKNRHAVGEASGKAKMTSETVIEARQRYREGERAASLARFYSITPQAMSSILKRKSWRHVP